MEEIGVLPSPIVTRKGGPAAAEGGPSRQLGANGRPIIGPALVAEIIKPESAWDVRAKRAQEIKQRLKQSWKSDPTVLREYFAAVVLNWKTYSGPRTAKQTATIWAVYRQATRGDCDMKQAPTSSKPVSSTFSSRSRDDVDGGIYIYIYIRWMLTCFDG